MIIRDLNPTDIQDGYALDRLLEGKEWRGSDQETNTGNVFLDRDYIIVATPGTDVSVVQSRPCTDDTGRRFVGCLIGRPCFYVHRFVTRGVGGCGNRQIAEGLIQAALSKASMMGVRDAVFTVHDQNDRMIAFIEDGRGMIRQDDEKVGRLAVYTSVIPLRYYPRVAGGGVR